MQDRLLCNINLANDKPTTVPHVLLKDSVFDPAGHMGVADGRPKSIKEQKGP
jgi:hypothetical protein